MQHIVQAKSYTVREWMLSQISPESWKLPTDDAVWGFITKTWPEIQTHTAEQILGAAMREIV